MFKLAKLAKRSKSIIDPTEPVDKDSLKNNIIDAIREIHDPEIAVNIYDLGLIYAIELNDDFFATIKMTLTAPACLVAESLPVEVKAVVRSVRGVSDAAVELVWDPPWSRACMSDEAKLQLGLW